MPDVNSIPFKQADPNGHYRSKQLPNDQHDFLGMLGLPAYAGDVVGPGGAVVNQVAVFADATGKRLNAATQTGLAKLAVGVLSSVPAPTGAVVGDTDVQTLTNKTLLNPVITGLTGLTKADVGLGNVDNTSDATKNSAAVTLTNKTIVSPTISSPSGLVKADVGLGNVDNTSDANKPISTAQAAVNTAKEDKANKGVALGYPTLDAGGKVPASQLPSTGASVYQGTWNASTNTPTIPAASAGNNGWYYNVNVAGTTNINGINSWAVGDQIISNGTVWQKIPSVQAVNSVNGYTGVVVLTKSDVGLSNVDNTSDANKPVSSATTTALALKEDKSAKGAVSGYAGLDASGKVPVAQLPTAALAAGDVVGPASSVAGELATYSDTTGKLVGRLTPPAGVLVGTTASQTLTNKILTSPTINTPTITSPTGIVKADVGLGNVDNTSDATKNAAVATLTNKTINGANNTLTVRLDTSDTINNLPVTKLNGGTGANSGSFWRGDGQWAPPAGGGDVVGPAGSVEGELPLYTGTTGKTLKRCNLSGFVKAAANGAATSQAQMGSADIATGAVGSTQLAAGAVVAASVDPAMITGQTEKTVICDPEDLFLIVDKATGLLRCVRSKWAGRLGRGQLGGMGLATSVGDVNNDIVVAVGECRDDTNVTDIVLSSALTKQMDAAWAAGNNAGGRDTGTTTADAWHVFVIKNVSSGAVDALFSLSPTAPTMPSGFTVKRRIGSIRRGASGIIPFKQYGNYFQRVSPLAEVSNVAITQADTLYTIYTVPTGLKFYAHTIVRMGANSVTANLGVVFRDPDQDEAANPTMFCSVVNLHVSSTINIWTSTAAQIVGRITGTGPANIWISTLGWIDYRGRED